MGMGMGMRMREREYKKGGQREGKSYTRRGEEDDNQVKEKAISKKRIMIENGEAKN